MQPKQPTEPKSDKPDLPTSIIEVFVWLGLSLFLLLVPVGPDNPTKPDKPGDPPAVVPEDPTKPAEPPEHNPDVPQVDDKKTAIVKALLTKHNEMRSAAGVPALTLNNRLVFAASRHAQWMADNKKMSHTGADGSNVATRIRAEGYSFRVAGENVAYGYRSVTTVMTGWSNSAGHKANILNSSYRDAGFAYASDAQGAVYWCAVFATPSTGFSSASDSDAVVNLPPPIFSDLNEAFNKTQLLDD